jgi:2-hydroxy-3-oxopropionate reductase
MAANLVKGGYDVVGYNRSAAGIAKLVAAGGRSASNVAEAVRGADVVVTMLPDSPQVEEVALGHDGILANSRPGLLYIDASTIAPAVSRSVARLSRELGVRPLDAPVSGGEAGAIEGSLSIMVGGDEDDFAAAAAVLGTMGKTVVRVGDDGAGQTVKAANQLIVAGVIELVAEAMVLLEACEVDLPAALEVLAGGLAGNRVLDRKAASMLAHDFRPGFRVDLHHKDLGITMATARDAGVPLPLGALVTQLIAALRARGGGSLDHSALLLLVEELAGRATAPAAATGAASSGLPGTAP